MMPFYLVIAAFLIPLFVVGWVHPKIVEIALAKNIVDKPGTRKLQRRPIPVLGGVAIFFGIVVGLGCMSGIVDTRSLLIVILAAIIMLYTGTIDDILQLTPTLRLLIEIVVGLLLIFVGGYCLDDFHGLWGIDKIPDGLAIPLTVAASVGIINAINLIDGVNGLSSGFCIVASAMFGTLFYLSGDITMTVLAAVSAGALVPFFFHNVFGKTSKMFIGDGGTLVMGVIMSIFVIEVLQYDSLCALYVGSNIGLIPLSLAVLAVPVFDTLRVMSTRMLRGTSPFHSDKTHIHHVFVGLGCSHIATTMIVLMLNASVVLCWWAVTALGASIDVQLYTVVTTGILITCGLYHFMEYQRSHNTRLMGIMHRLGYRTHISRRGFFLWLQNTIDKI